MTTFAELGIDLPLFAASVDEATGWAPGGACALCGEDRAGFSLDSSAAIATTCASCGSGTAAAAAGGSTPCPSCGHGNVLATAVAGEHGCWWCLRTGRWSHTVDTEAGMVRWVDAIAGRTHGQPLEPEPEVWAMGADGADSVPDRSTPTIVGFATVEGDEPGWRRAVIPSDLLLDLTRTPRYSTWQGENWLFHCGRPMRYLGRWGRSSFDAEAPDGDGRSLAWRAVELDDDAWDRGLAATADGSRIAVYVFRCTTCTAVRGHWDAD